MKQAGENDMAASYLAWLLTHVSPRTRGINFPTVKRECLGKGKGEKTGILAQNL